MPGVNIDVLNPSGNPTIDQLKSLNIDSVRLVSKPDPNNATNVHPDIEQKLLDLKNAGIFALVTIANESQGRIPANNHGWLQFGNEPDGQPPSSWVMTPDEYVQQFNLYSTTYSQFNWIAAGLAAGDYTATFWKAVGPRLQNCKGFALHPYSKTPYFAQKLVQDHQAITPDMMAFVTEFNCDASYIALMLWDLTKVTAGQYWFCWSDGMVPGFGLSDHPDKVKAWLDGISRVQHRKPVVPAAPVAPPAPVMPVLRQWDSNNYWGGRPDGPPIALVIHTEAGSEGGTESEFTNNAAQVSAHFGVGLDGRDDQFVQLGDSAWANGIFESGNQWLANGLPNVNPNYLTVSIETEDLGNNNQPVTDAQYASVKADCQLAISTYPSIKYLLGHCDISPHSRVNCPGNRWIGTGKFQQLAQELGLIHWH